MTTPQQWYGSLPPLTRYWLTAAVVTGFGCKFGLIPLNWLHLDWTLILSRLQIWRLVTPFLFFGFPSFPWLMLMFMMSQFLPSYEYDPYPSGGGFHRGNLADILTMLGFGGALLMFISWIWTGNAFLASPLFFMVIYVWSRRHPETQTSFYMFRVPAAYLPWVMVGFSVVVGGDPVPDLMGIAAGHVYWFVQEQLPDLETPLKGRRLLQTPRFLYALLNENPTYAPSAQVRIDQQRQGAGGPQNRFGGHQWGQGNRLGGQ